MDGVRKLADQYANRGLVVYWVSTDSDNPKSKNYANDQQLRDFSKKFELNVTVLRDPDGVVGKHLGVTELPAIVILDKQGKIFGEVIGGIDENGDVPQQLAPTLKKVM
jgi:peroxiredoxin